MSEQIGVGDFVQVVKPSPCCGSDYAIGKTFRVAKIDPTPGHCAYCQVRSTKPAALRAETGMWYLVVRLKKLPPLTEPETREQEMTV